MRIEREKDKVYFLLEENELEVYDVTLEQLRLMKPFKADILDYLAQKAHIEYGKEYEYEFSKMKITVFAKHVLISMTEKSNVVHIENDFTEQEAIVDGLQELYRYLPDDKIHMGIMDVVDKKKLLTLYRRDEGKELIREEIRKFGGLDIV